MFVDLGSAFDTAEVENAPLRSGRLSPFSVRHQTTNGVYITGPQIWCLPVFPETPTLLLLLLLLPLLLLLLLLVLMLMLVIVQIDD